MYKVNFNGVQLDEYFIIKGVNRSILPNRVNTGKKIPCNFGEVYFDYTYDTKLISLDCFLEADSEEDRIDKQTIIADILNVKDPVKVIISDDPNKYFYAVVDGETPVNKLGFSSEFTITLKTYDIFKYDVEEEYFGVDEGTNTVTVSNTGGVETSPLISVEFLNKANFLQITTEDDKTLLLGSRPDIDSKPTSDIEVLKDKCETTSDWVIVKKSVDGEFYDLGTFGVNGGGYGLICNDYGVKELPPESDPSNEDFMKGWHGVSIKRNFGRSVNNFDLTIWLEHNSKGSVTGGGSSAPSTGKYKVSSSARLNLREGRGTNYPILEKIPVGTTLDISEIDKGWGKTTYKSKTGYVSMDCVTKINPDDSNANIEATGDVFVRSGAGTKYKKLTVAKKGTKSTKLDKSGDWYKVKVNGHTGWSHSKYWKTIKGKSKAKASTENKIGRVEVYGYDTNGTKLFKFELIDNEKYYEFTKPSIYIANELILSENKTVPNASSDNGKFGDWNEFKGTFKIRRETKEGKQYWSAKISKYKDDKVIKSIGTNLIYNENYPTQELAYIVVSFGQYKDNIVVDTMAVTDVKLKEIKGEDNSVSKNLFWAGDVVLIDNEKQEVTCNGIPIMESLDIGSEFFDIPVGNSSFNIYSDCDLEVDTTIRRKWL